MEQRESGCLETYRHRDKLYDLWLCSFPGMGNMSRCRLAEKCGGAHGAYFSSSKKWAEVLSPKQVEELKIFTASWKPEAEYRKMEDMGIALILKREAAYPERLGCISDAPYGLFVRGSLEGEERLTVAVVGARECSQYGAYVAEQLGALLGKRGIVVVSGMARGIDGISQMAALAAGGCSWGVLGSGVDVCYPARHSVLYGKLIEQGAVISEYPVGTPARPQNFPSRNRIVSGLADAVVVVEARDRSGTLITVDTALEQGREVYAVPGRITDRLSDGCNRLIRQGAGLLLEPGELLAELEELAGRRGERREREDGGTGSGIEGRESGKKKRLRTADDTEQRGMMQLPGREKDLPPELEAVYQSLDLCPRSSACIGEELAEKHPEYAGKSIATYLMKLCMENLAQQVSPGYFCRKT